MPLAQIIPTDSVQNLVRFPTRYAPDVPGDLPAPAAARAGTTRPGRVRTGVIRQVTVLEVAGRLEDVVDDLDQAIQIALADGPRGVVCDLSGLVACAGPGAVEMLATAGRHVRDWPGTPVAVACGDQRIRDVLGAHSLGRHLIVAESMFSAVSAVLLTPVLVVERLTLAAHPTARRASRGFVARILRDRQLDSAIPFASEMVAQLVASSSANAGTDIDLSVACNDGALRLTVRDHGPALPGPGSSVQDLQGRGLSVVVAGRTRTFGFLPTADGGKLVWAVLEAPGQHSWVSNNAMDAAKGEPVRNPAIARLAATTPQSVLAT